MSALTLVNDPPAALAVSPVFEISDKLPDIIITLRQFPTEVDHARSLDTVINRIKNLLILATLKPAAIKKIWRLGSLGRAIMAIATTGSRIDHLTPLQRGSIVKQHICR